MNRCITDLPPRPTSGNCWSRFSLLCPPITLPLREPELLTGSGLWIASPESHRCALVPSPLPTGGLNVHLSFQTVSSWETGPLHQGHMAPPGPGAASALLAAWTRGPGGAVRRARRRGLEGVNLGRRRVQSRGRGGGLACRGETGRADGQARQ